MTLSSLIHHFTSKSRSYVATGVLCVTLPPSPKPTPCVTLDGQIHTRAMGFCGVTRGGRGWLALLKEWGCHIPIVALRHE